MNAMVKNRLLEIAKELAALYMDRAAQRNMLATFENHQTTRELQLLPEGGWAGKNEGERTAAKMTALMNDEQWTMGQDGLLDTRQNLNDIEGCMAGLRCEQAAIEWTIRDVANTLLGAPSVLDSLVDNLKDTVQEMVTDTEAAGWGMSIIEELIRNGEVQPTPEDLLKFNRWDTEDGTVKGEDDEPPF